MDQNTNPVAAPAVAPATPAATMPSTKAQKDHWMVEVAGGVTLGTTIMAALALWMVVLNNYIFA